MNWRSHSTRFNNCDLLVSNNDDGMVVINGSLKNLYQDYKKIIGDVYIKYWAPNMSNNATNVSGVAIPYPNESMAFGDTINKGVVRVVNDNFRFNVYRPQQYYLNTGKTAVRPNVKLIFCNSDMKPFSSTYTLQL